MPSHARQRFRSNTGTVIGNLIVNPGFIKATQQLWPIEVCSAIFRIVEAATLILEDNDPQGAAAGSRRNSTMGNMQLALGNLEQTLRHVRKLDANRQSQNQPRYSKAEKTIAKLARDCFDLATNLSKDLGDSKPLRPSVADGYTSRFRQLDEQVSAALRQALRDGTSSLSRRLDSDKSKNLRMTGKVAEAMTSATSNLQALLGTTSASAQDPPVPLGSIIESIDNLRDKSRDIAMRNIILESLYFPEISERQTSVHQRGKHAHTFEWVFEQRHEDLDLHFGTWLESEDGHFWITGRAGSGKSTMLAWLYNDSRADDMLVTWAGSASLVKGGFFFWSAGTPLQRSQEGLWRSILFQLLCHQSFKESAWRIIEQENFIAPAQTGWTVKRLLRLLELLISDATSSTRFCFFIDGLDEYTEDDSASLQDVSLQLKGLASLPGVKMCIASRDWPQIKAVFAYPAERTLVLHNHTKTDLRKYVSDLIQQDPLFDKMVRNDARYQELAEKLVTKAHGVFLWTFYVVRDLKRTFAALPTYDEVMQFIDKCPPDLDHYYQRMTAAIPLQFKAASSRILLMCLHARQDLPVLTFTNVLELPSHGDGFSAISSKGETRLMPELAQIYQERITARCLDIVEAHGTGEHIFVGYIHRTAFDYFRHDKIYQMLRRNAGHDFSPSYALCEAFLGLLRLYEAQWAHASWRHERKPAENYLNWLLRSAADYEQEYHRPALEPLDAAEELLQRAPRPVKDGLCVYPVHNARRTLQSLLDRTIESLVERGQRDNGSQAHTYDYDDDTMPESTVEAGKNWNIVIARSIQEGLTYYVRYRCTKDKRLLTSVHGYPTLCLALVPHDTVDHWGTNPQLPRLKLKHRETFDMLVGLSGQLERNHLALFTFWILQQTDRLKRTEMDDLAHVASSLVALGLNPYRNHVNPIEYACALRTTSHSMTRFTQGTFGLSFVRPLHIEYRLNRVLGEDQLLDLREAYHRERSGTVAALWSTWGRTKGRLTRLMWAWFSLASPSFVVDDYYTNSSRSTSEATRHS